MSRYVENRICDLTQTDFSDRTQPVNKGDHISARLVRLMTSTALPHTKDSLCDLFYVLCDEDGKFPGTRMIDQKQLNNTNMP